MTAISIEEQQAYDLHRTAIHECGHAALIRNYGMWGTPTLWRNPSGNLTEEKYWHGTTLYQAPGMTLQIARRIALAGRLAEMIDSYGSPMKCDEYNLEDFVEDSHSEDYDEFYGWSHSDWEGSLGWTSKDVLAVYKTLKRNWSRLLKEANRLKAMARRRGAAFNSSYHR